MTEQELKVAIEKRNNRLLNFFKKMLNDEVQLVGKKESPSVVINSEMRLACYVKNFELIFIDRFFNGKEIFRVKLLHESNMKIDGSMFAKWMQEAEHFEVFKIKTDNGLYLTGFDKSSNGYNYPTFGMVNPKIFLSENYCQEIIDKYESESLKMQIE